MAATQRWYAIRSAPGAQRVAKKIEGLPDRRQLESILERNLRNDGIECYMPSYYVLTKHQRTNKLIEKRCPFLVGYAFVCITGSDFERVRRVEGVSSFLRGNNGPAVFADEDIGSLMFAERERNLAYAQERMERKKRADQHRANQLNRNLGLIFPKGRNRGKLSLKEYARQELEKLPRGSRDRVLCIIAELDRMADDNGLAKLAMAS